MIQHSNTQQNKHLLSFGIVSVIAVVSVLCAAIFALLLISVGVDASISVSTSFLLGSQAALASLLLGTQAALASLLLGTRAALAEAVTISTDQLVKIIVTTGVDYFLVLFISVSIISFLILGVLFDRELTFATVSAITEPLSKAIPIVWRTFSNPKVILAYGLFFIMVSFFPQIPDALKSALIKSQKIEHHD